MAANSRSPKVHSRSAKRSMSAPDLAADGNFVVVRQWQELVQAVERGPFDVVYYFGPSRRTLDQVSLVFEAGEGRGEDPHSAVELANVLRRLKQPPRLAVLNTTQPDSPGLLGLGRQLGSFIPSVITQRRALAALELARWLLAGGVYSPRLSFQPATAANSARAASSWLRSCSTRFFSPARRSSHSAASRQSRSAQSVTIRW